MNTHPARALGIAKEREDRVGDRPRLVPHVQPVDALPHDLAERRDVAGDDR